MPPDGTKLSGFSTNPLTNLIRTGAHKLIVQTAETELATLLAAFAENRLENALGRLVRHCHLPERDGMRPGSPRCLCRCCW